MRTAVAIFLMALAGCSQNSPRAATKTEPGPARITQFYASPPNPPKGEKALVCYGVENATEVRLDPPVERVWPAASRCFDFVPQGEAALILSARRGSEQVSRSLTLKPGPAQVKLLQVSINKLEFAAGETVTICFQARNATTVTIQPGQAFRSQNTGCIEDHPKQTTTYVVRATGAGGDTDSEKVTATVK